MNGAALLTTAYLAPVAYYSVLLRAETVVIEKHCHYIKQTYRNRCYIATANGIQMLTIPVEKQENHKCLSRDIRISSHGNWQRLHWNAIVSAYNSSPFFEYYEDDFRPFFFNKFQFLFDFNEQLREATVRLLDLQPAIKYSTEYEKDFEGHDLREAIHPKKDCRALVPGFPKPYYQVFDYEYGFIPDLSIIDLLFNMGPESLLVL